MHHLTEPSRRKPGAEGVSATLGDGQVWLLAEPTFRPKAGALTTPNIDAVLDRTYERIILGENLPLDDLLAVARILLLANYDLSDAEAHFLLDVDAGEDAEALARAIAEAMFGPEQRVRSYTDWVRASLLCNGLTSMDVPASALNDVLTLLLASGRTVPPTQFIDACRLAEDREFRERLV